MASNRLPNSIEPLFGLADLMIAGDTALGPALHIVQNPASVIKAALDAARLAEANYLASRATRRAAFERLQVAEGAALAFVATGKRALAGFFGARWNAAWVPVGFINASLEIPTGTTERLGLLGVMRDFLTNHGEYENEPMGFTATHAAAVYTEFLARRDAANNGLDGIGAARAERNVAEEALRVRMRGLITELATLLKPDDSRWYSFGLNAPADPNTPEAPEAPLVTPGAPGSGALMLDWHTARRAERYRIRLRKPGDPDFLPLLTVHDHECAVTGLPLGVPLALRLTAANDAGESVPGPEVVVTLS